MGRPWRRSSSSSMDAPGEGEDPRGDGRTRSITRNTYITRVQPCSWIRLCRMQKKLTITIDEVVYRGLYERVGSGKISRFIEQLVRPHVLPRELDDAYAAMARDEAREADASEWAEGLIGDVPDDSR